MTKRKKTVAEKTADHLNTLPRHPRHQDFLNAAIKHLADDVRTAADPDAPVTEEEATAGARLEFETGIAALAFIPDDDCFHVVWSSAAWYRMLRPYVVKAWEAEPAAYGSNPPISHEPKRKPKLH
jgi:hypothetical protein